jgi:hypothetical protein
MKIEKTAENNTFLKLNELMQSFRFLNLIQCNKQTEKLELSSVQNSGRIRMPFYERQQRYFIKTVSLMILLISSTCSAQMSISIERQREIIEKLSADILKLYHTKTTAQSISDTLMIINSKLQSEISASDFEKTINSVLYQKSNDNHLKIYFDTKKFESFSQDDLEKRKFNFENDKKTNFGFTKIEILDGNIGYIELVKCSGFIAEEVAQKIASSMNIIENTNALIIDLRKNGGGDGRVGEILATYFYPEENEVYYDSISRSEKFRVLPFVSGKRYLERQVYILTGLMTFSAAEGFANFMQRNHKALIVGEKTKGGGSSGSSVPLKDGFLCFIPTNFGVSDEEASVNPNFEIAEKDALNYAKYLFFKDELNKKTMTDENDIAVWNFKTCEYLLHLNEGEFKLNKKLIGKFESGREVIVKENQLYFSVNNKIYRLSQISDFDFVVEGFEGSFGAGNRRIKLKNNELVESIYLNGQIINKTWAKIK